MQGLHDLISQPVFVETVIQNVEFSTIAFCRQSLCKMFTIFSKSNCWTASLSICFLQFVSVMRLLLRVMDNYLERFT